MTTKGSGSLWGDESNSVVNQRRLLEQYHQAHLDEFYEGAEADVYVDDGKTCLLYTS